MSMHESGEMYLETILILSEKLPNVRSIDIGDHMGYSKPSVSRAVGLLKKEGMIRMDSSGYITLPEAGEEKAKRIYERHTLLTQLLINLGVDEQTAAYDACRVEHYISDTTFDAIKAHVKKYGSKN